jgi:hypothetical protein
MYDFGTEVGPLDADYFSVSPFGAMTDFDLDLDLCSGDGAL